MTGFDGHDSYCLRVLEELGQNPAVSFMEDTVVVAITKVLEEIGLPVDSDNYGNIITTFSGPKSGDNVTPPIAFVAHMDHPGFEVIDKRDGGFIARALGGVPPSCFSSGVPLRVIAPDGRTLIASTSGRYGTEDQRSITLRLDDSEPPELPLAAVLELPDFSVEGDQVHMRAADDLAGCAIILAALRELVQNTGRSDQDTGQVQGIFTRAEEVGLVGARLLAEGGSLPKETLVVSLEASRNLPGALMGEGPVIRVGDASFTFDADAESVLNKAREELQEELPGFKCQRQLMSGGTCEASAFIYYGYRATGVALPLGNYHNATPEGGIGAEYINIDDLESAVALIARSARCVRHRQDSRSWRRMADLPEEFRGKLSRSPI